MKKLFLMMFLLNIFFAHHIYAAKSVWDGKSSDTSWYDENASEFHINSAAQFKGFADLVSYNNCTFEGKTVYLDCDIDLDNHYWSPIGLHSGKPFSGIFDGANHNIANLLINTNHFDYPDMKDNVGLFGYANKATIKNISVQGGLEIYSGRYIGGIAAFINRIENVYSDIRIELHDSKSSGNIGTVAGIAEYAARLYSKGEISCEQKYIGLQTSCYVGGVFGSCTNIVECCSDVDVYVNIIGTSNEHIGGISGQSGNISNALFIGEISISNYNCYNDNFIPNIGGICGRVDSGDHIISAPSFMAYGRGFATAKSALIPSTSNASVAYAYYLNTWATNKEKYGEAISEKDLKSGSALSGFDTKIWEFKENEYPSLISLKNLIPKPTYTVSYYIDGLLYQIDEYKEDEAVIPPADPVKEGYTFTGWDYIPPFVGNSNWYVHGSFSINKYTISYMIEGEVYKTVSQEYNTYINPPTAFPLKQGYLFEWGEYPEKVPAHDITIEGVYIKDTYEYVDLGLPSGLLWATKNIGAANPEDYGYYFSWGETNIKESYYWGTYKYCNGSGTTLSKYCYSSDFGDVDNKYSLDKEDDAATQNWGEKWRLPSLEDVTELCNNCYADWVKINGISGLRITGPNGNTMFIPSAGTKQYKTNFHKGADICLLTSTLYGDGHPDLVTVFRYRNYSFGVGGEERGFGYSARAVYGEPTSGIVNAALDNNDNGYIYDLYGRKVVNNVKGINVIRYKNGKTKKIIR